MYILYFLLQSSFKELEQQELFPLIRGIVVQRENNSVHKFS
jgi:hypothetical protein